MGGHWYKEAIIYELHVKCFSDSSGDGFGDFNGLTEKLDYLQDIGITAIWLLPFYPSPLRDDGYDIADYQDVHPQYGKLSDFKRFLKEAHKRGLRVITELVINHTSDQHIWFQKASREPSGGKWREFYVWNDVTDKYKDARIIFQDFETSNWTWDPIAKSYFWHRFYSHQPDLNFENPEVHEAVFENLRFWMEMGVDGVRLDAVPYLYEREGTVCENLPETHAFLQKLRAYIDEHFEDKMLLAEANQWPEDAAKYFGEGNECQMAFHFPVMPRLFMAIHLEDALPIVEIMAQTPEIPESCQWALFLRNHDELTLEMVTDEERDYMFRVYAHDPQARVNLGIRRRLAPLLKNDRRKIELMNALLFSLTGTPVLYYGDEIGMGDNIYLGDRDGVRTPMQWSNDRNAGFSRANPQQLYLPPIIDPEYHFETVNVEAQLSNPHSLLWWTKQLISLRKRYKAFSYGSTHFLRTENRKLLVFFREYEGEILMIIANLSRFPQYVELDLKEYEGNSLVEMFSGHHFPKIGELPYFLTLGPYGYYWFSLEKEPEKVKLGAKERHVAEVALENLFHPSMRRTLDQIVRRYLQKRSHLAELMAHIDRTKTHIIDTLFLPAQKMHLVFMQIVLTRGVAHYLSLYLRLIDGVEGEEKLKKSPECVLAKSNGTILHDDSDAPAVSQFLLDAISNKQQIDLDVGMLRGVSLTDKRGDLKRFFLLDEERHLDVEMRTFLAQKTDFTSYLPLVGFVEYTTTEGRNITLAEEVSEHREEFNAKEHAIEAAERFLMRMEAIPAEEIVLPKGTLLDLAYGDLQSDVHSVLEEHLEVARLMGETTAAFHQAMRSDPIDPSFAPTPFSLFYQRSIYQTMRRKLTEASLKLGRALIKEPYLKQLEALPRHKLNEVRQRCHGNYRLEHLHYSGKEFLIANFEGKPYYSYHERRYKRSPLIDCASMLLSLAEAGFEAIERLQARGIVHEEQKKMAHLWSLWIGSSFLRAYFRTLKEERTPELHFLLGAVVIEECAERVLTVEGKQLEAVITMLQHWLPIYEKVAL